MWGIWAPEFDGVNFTATLQDGYRLRITFGRVWECAILRPFTFETFESPDGTRRPQARARKGFAVVARWQCDNLQYCKKKLIDFFSNENGTAHY